MTTYGAYDRNLPCKNESCNSFGKSHPNCKCYGGFADGGDVMPFCSQSRNHMDGCEFSMSPQMGSLGAMDPNEAVTGYLMGDGLQGVIGMNKQKSENAMFKYDKSVKKGLKNLHSEIDKIFTGDKSEKQDITKAKESINDWLAKGGIDADLQQEIYKQNAPALFANGGQVANDSGGVLNQHPIEQQYPQQNILINTIKGRASNYLNSLRPKEVVSGLMFDEKPNQVTQEKTYDRALKIAANPSRILTKIKDGTITPEHLQHFSSLYPEMANTIQRKLTEKILNERVEGKKPSYKVRQGLSLLLGAPLSSEMLPMNIQAAQSAFQLQRAQNQKDQNNDQPKKSAGSLSKMSQSLLTADDAAASRQQKQ